MQLPDNLWEHRLFEGSARHVAPTSNLAVARCDARLRKLRHMPSTGDGTPDALSKGMVALFRTARRWIDGARGSEAEHLRTTLRYIERVGESCSDATRADLWRRRIERIGPQIPVNLRDYLPDRTTPAADARVALQLLSLLLVDEWLAADGSLGRKYAKHAYRLADRALAYNSTTDPARLHPVLVWILSVLLAEGRRGCSFLDVGCGMAGGAPGTVLAAGILRRDGVCDTVHGMDVVAPERAFAVEMVRRRKVYLYASDPVRRVPTAKYDVILLANVHRHLDAEAQTTLLEYLGDALHPRGKLFVNWRFDASYSPCLCLGRDGGRLLVEGERNCIADGRP